MREKRGVAIAMACSTLLLLTGCLPNLRHAEMGPALPTDFVGRTSLDNSARLGIDEFFGDPVLTGLIAQGLSCNQELKIRNQEVQISANEVLARRGAYLPFVSLRGSGGMERTSKFTPLGTAEEELEFLPGKHYPDPLPNVLVAADLFWRVDIWREFRNARDAAAQRYTEAVDRRDYFVTQLVAEIAENYYELAALDKRLVFLDQTIDLQQSSLRVAEAQKAAAEGTELGVQRLMAEVRKNESQRLIVRQRIIEIENRINFLVGRYPQAVDRAAWDLVTLDSRMLNVGAPAQLLLNRRDIRAAERELAAAGLDILVARARFFPRLDITAGIGFEAFNPRYLFDPGAFIANAAGDLIVPLINRKAIQADYQTANARQLQAVYDYQRTVLNAFTEVVNSISKVENYRRSVQIKQDQVVALETSVDVAMRLYEAPIPEPFARVEYIDVLLATRDLLEARTALIETKQQQLAAIVSAYQALGGGYMLSSTTQTLANPAGAPLPPAPGDVLVPPLPSDAPSAPGKATVTPEAAPPAGAEEAAPPAAAAGDTPLPGDAATPSVPGGAAAPSPAEDATPPATEGDSTPVPTPSNATFSPTPGGVLPGTVGAESQVERQFPPVTFPPVAFEKAF